jgi:hypothetical protein
MIRVYSAGDREVRMDDFTLPARRQAFGLVHYLAWIGLSAAAVLVGMVASYAFIFVAKGVNPGLNEDRLMGWALMAVLGAFIGMAQWLLLRGRLPRAGLWILVTAAGLWAGTTLAFRLTGMRLPILPYQLLLGGAVTGFILALAQLLVLRPTRRGIVIWLLAGALGWLFLTLVTGESLDRTTDLLALGAVPAAVSGLALAWFWRDLASPRDVEA